MSAVMITGISGAGKSTIAELLARRGLAAIDADNDPSLSRFVDRAGAVVEFPAAPDLAWLARHSWEWDPARLDELILAVAPSTLYVCGGAANEWGRVGDTRENLRRRLSRYQDGLRSYGAIPVDATQPLDQVVDAILSRTAVSSTPRWRDRSRARQSSGIRGRWAAARS